MLSWRRLGECGLAKSDMLILRFVLVLMLVVSGVCFGAYALTRDQRYLRWGWLVLRLALFAALVFFGVLILERVL